MKKMKLFMMGATLLMIAGMVMTACSSDDVEQQAVEVSLKTINEKGAYSNVFSNEENILFDLNIKNNTNDTITFAEPFLFELVHSFKLYSSSGAFIGYPFNGIDMLKLQDTFYYLMPFESRQWLCMYMTHQTEMDFKSPLESTRIKEPLSHGEYYLLYSLTLGKETKTGKIAFKIE